MYWVAKDPPIYVWKNDQWYNERNGLVYDADLKRQVWVNGENLIPFPKKVKVLDPCE